MKRLYMTFPDVWMWILYYVDMRMCRISWFRFIDALGTKIYWRYGGRSWDDILMDRLHDMTL